MLYYRRQFLYIHTRARVDWAAWLPDTCQVGRLVRGPGGPPR